jgi:deazaflavin-dependent oxidoreductase (nitroreductase family)
MGSEQQLAMNPPSIRWWQRMIQTLAMTDLMSAAFLAKYLYRMDLAVLKWSHGRNSLTTWLAGLPVVVLTTTGAKTGKARTVPLAGFPDGDNLFLIPSSFGASHHPAWFHNLSANPRVQINLNGESKEYQARVVDDEIEREVYWQLALDYYPGYQLYAHRSGGRQIPVILLEPVR